MTTYRIEADNLIELLTKLGWKVFAGNLWTKGEYIMTFEDAIAFELYKATQVKDS